MQNDMRDRLVEIINKDNCPSPYICSDKCKYSHLEQCIGDRLADCILADGWIRPPCKVGQTVYVLFPDPRYNWGNEEITMFESKVYGFHYCDGNDGTIELKDSKHHIKWGIDSFGVSIFLTKEQAEQKLKELNE